MESLKRTGTEKLKSIQINLPPHVTIKQESRAVARKPQDARELQPIMNVCLSVAVALVRLIPDESRRKLRTIRLRDAVLIEVQYK